jgi:hypothetical protein
VCSKLVRLAPHEVGARSAISYDGSRNRFVQRDRRLEWLPAQLSVCEDVRRGLALRRVTGYRCLVFLLGSVGVGIYCGFVARGI